MASNSRPPDYETDKDRAKRELKEKLAQGYEEGGLISPSNIHGQASTKGLVMEESLACKVDNFTPLQKRYAEYRSKGLRQADAALKAGSGAQGRAALGRVGYNWEQLEGMKEYISYLYEKRANAAILDDIEVLEKLRANYEEALNQGRIDWANKAAELMGHMIGAFKDGSAKSSNTSKTSSPSNQQLKNNVEAFKNEEEDTSAKDRMKTIDSLIKTLGG